MKRGRYLLPLAMFLILAAFILYPTITVLLRSVVSEGQVSLTNYVEVFTNPHLQRLIANSVLVSISSAVISTLLGLIVSLAVYKTELLGRRLFWFAVVLPMVFPGFVKSLSYTFLFGRNGLITYKLLKLTWNVYSWRSVLILQSLGLSTTFLLISAVLTSVDSRVEDAARNLGASEWKVLTTVTLPLIRPALISAALLAFLRSMADFSTPTSLEVVSAPWPPAPTRCSSAPIT